jgi:TolA-binding protein
MPASEDDASECPICRGDMALQGPHLGALQCGHVFHVQCLMDYRRIVEQGYQGGGGGAKLLKRALKCPICRQPIRRAVRLLFSATSLVTASPIKVKEPERQAREEPTNDGNLARGEDEGSALLQTEINRMSQLRHRLECDMRDLRERVDRLGSGLKEQQCQLNQRQDQEERLIRRHQELLDNVCCLEGVQIRLMHDLTDARSDLTRSQNELMLLRSMTEQLDRAVEQSHAAYLVHRLWSTVLHDKPADSYLLEFVTAGSFALETQVLEHLGAQWTVQSQQLQSELMTMQAQLSSFQERLQPSSPIVQGPRKEPVTAVSKKLTKQTTSMKKPLLASIVKPPRVGNQHQASLLQTANGLGGVGRMFTTKDGRQVYFPTD